MNEEVDKRVSFRHTKSSLGNIQLNQKLIQVHPYQNYKQHVKYDACVSERERERERERETLYQQVVAISRGTDYLLVVRCLSKSPAIMT